MKQVFKTRARNYVINELKSWLWVAISTVIIYLAFRYGLGLSKNDLSVPLCAPALLKLGDLLVQYCVKEIHINEPDDKITFSLFSILSGNKLKQFPLSQSTAAILEKSSIRQLFGAGIFLRIINKEEHSSFTISTRYGFSANDLKAIYHKVTTQTTSHKYPGKNL